MGARRGAAFALALSAGALTPFASATGGVNAPAEAERPKATSIFREYMVGSSRLQTPRYPKVPRSTCIAPMALPALNVTTNSTKSDLRAKALSPRMGGEGTLASLAAAAKELQLTAMTARVGMVTVSAAGSDLERQLAATGRAARACERVQQRVCALGGSSAEGAASFRPGDGHRAATDTDTDTAHRARMLDLHEEYVRSRTILQLARFRPVVLDAAYGEDTGASPQRRALKAALTDRAALVRELTRKVAEQRELESQVAATREERLRLMQRNQELAADKARLERACRDMQVCSCCASACSVAANLLAATLR